MSAIKLRMPALTMDTLCVILARIVAVASFPITRHEDRDNSYATCQFEGRTYGTVGWKGGWLYIDAYKVRKADMLRAVIRYAPDEFVMKLLRLAQKEDQPHNIRKSMGTAQ